MRFTLNGKPVALEVAPMRRLLDVVREECGLTGTKEGCGEGECGACTVLLDGAPVNSCLVPVAQAEGARVTTIEGLRGHAKLQHAFVTEGGAQCGICTPGFLLAAQALPKGASLEAVKQGLAGNLCRCTGYAGIYRSIAAARGGARPAPKSRPAPRAKAKAAPRAKAKLAARTKPKPRTAASRRAR